MYYCRKSEATTCNYLTLNIQKTLDQTKIEVFDTSPAPYISFVNNFGDTARSLVATASTIAGSSNTP